MRREVLDQLGGFRDDPDFVTTEDYDLWLRVAQAGFTVSFIDDVLGSFRRHNASASSAPIRHLNAELSVIDDHFRTRLPQGVKEHKRRRALAYYTAARTFSKDGRTWEGFRMFASSLRMNPLNARTWAGLGVHLISLLQNPLNRTRRD
jgi:GT2 family glycosyltransferase